MTTHLISAITQQTDYLLVQFEQEWFQEDVANLTALVFASLMPISIQEKILGADRENIRFAWREHYFILNFECNSQSCWLEGQDSASMEYLADLYSVLANLLLGK